ncbi:dermonecrotic toxin domain-containing protein [Pseudomonas atagonensis]|uniref:dermonecrotic toxin domain-containing protein n=1 Tax=Pseudomonas atagonensis TaxID=2609964 RepID=UPI001FE4106E|nr:DUF6543 domain-containing protein [Pseudomonas atagonensis]
MNQFLMLDKFSAADLLPGRHTQLIAGNLPSWLVTATPQRLRELNQHQRTIPEWVRRLTPVQRHSLRNCVAENWSAQNEVDGMFKGLQDVYAFAEPLLLDALEKKFGIAVDVRETFIKLYAPAKVPLWGTRIDDSFASTTYCLLDVALHNFSEHQEILPGSEYITRPDANGRFEINGELRNRMSVGQFKHLSRELDLGAKYRVYLESYLKTDNALANGLLKSRVVASQKNAWKVAAMMAVLKQDISADAYLLVLAILKGSTGLHFDGGPVRYYHLSLLDIKLTGIVLIAPDIDAAQAVKRVIVYSPQDPEHPMKEYPSAADFLDELTRQLRGAPDEQARVSRYQQYFSRFVPHRQRGHFFAGLQRQLWKIVGSDSLRQPQYGPQDKPRLRYSAVSFVSELEQRFNGDVWEYLYIEQLNKILNDGRDIAISTADADREEREKWLDNLQQMFLDILNVALLVATPFVPLLGEVMLMYTVYQMTSEVVEGVLDLSEGLYLEATDHLLGFVESVGQLLAFGAGAAIGSAALGRLSPLIERATPVTLSNGEKRLWAGNLQPYLQSNLRFDPAAKADASGLYAHGDKRVLRLPQGAFEVKDDPLSGDRRILHPEREDAYRPQLKEHGAGRFMIEGEQPHTWDEQTLMRRIGSSFEELHGSFADLRQLSRIELDTVRNMHVEGEPTLSLLNDFATRFGIDRDIETFIRQIGSDNPLDYRQADPLIQFALLDGLWSGPKLELVDAQGQVIERIGSGERAPVRIDASRLGEDDLASLLLRQLNDAQTRELLQVPFGTPLSRLDVNAGELRRQLALRAQQRKATLFENRYRQLNNALHNQRPQIRIVQAKLPELPAQVAEELLTAATPSELQEVALGKLPARLENLARQALLEIRVARAYEPFYLKSVDNPDSRRLALHSLENLPGWNPDVRIEVSLYEFKGTTADSIGQENAAIRRTIVELENLAFQAFDDVGNSLNAPADFYSTILQALPDAERNALGLRIGEGDKLQNALRDRTLSHHRLKKILSSLPPLERRAYDPLLARLRGGARTDPGEALALQEIYEFYPGLVDAAYHPDDPIELKYNFLRGLSRIEMSDGEYLLALRDGFLAATSDTDVEVARTHIVRSIEALPELEVLMSPEQFQGLFERMFTEQGFVPLTSLEQNLGAYARSLEQTGRVDSYQKLQRDVLAGKPLPDYALTDFSTRYQLVDGAVDLSQAPVQVSPEIMNNLKMAQRAIYRAKELLPLSGNQLPSIWEKGGSAIAKIKGLRGFELIEGSSAASFKANMSIAEHARKAIAIRGGNCSENSKVTFSLLASQPRTTRIHIVKATEFDHQYVLIGDDLTKPEQLVVADSWPEFPAAHLADAGYFSFEVPPVITLEAGPAVADYSFINDLGSDLAPLPIPEQSNTFRQIKLNKLYVQGAYAQWSSLKLAGRTYALAGETPVSFEQFLLSTLEARHGAWEAYLAAFADVT